MSQSRQPYIKLKQFLEQLAPRRHENINLEVQDYCLVTFPDGVDYTIDFVPQMSNWNVINLTRYTEPKPALFLYNHLQPLAEWHPDAAVTIDRYLFTGFHFVPATTYVRLNETTLNLTPVSSPLSPQEFATKLNELNVTNIDIVLDLAVAKFPDLSITFFRVGDRWMTQEDLHRTYPKIANYQYSALFAINKTKGNISVCECQIPPAKMQQHFGLTTKNLIEQLLEESNSTVPAK
jgi:hypothetical protein